MNPAWKSVIEQELAGLNEARLCIGDDVGKKGFRVPAMHTTLLKHERHSFTLGSDWSVLSSWLSGKSSTTPHEGSRVFSLNRPFERQDLAEYVLSCGGGQPRLVAYFCRRVAWWRRWCERRRAGLVRHQVEIERQQSKWAEHLDRAAAMIEVAR
jgi:hypothetical protein